MRIGEGVRPSPLHAPTSEALALEARPDARSGGGADEPSPFAKLLRGLGGEVDRGETMMKGFLRGGADLGADQLLALQAGVYRYGVAVDLSAKLVDRATTGLKTVVQGQ